MKINISQIINLPEMNKVTHNFERLFCLFVLNMNQKSLILFDMKSQQNF